MRTLVDLPDSQIQALAALCDQVKQPRAALIREAVAEYLLKHRAQESVDEAFGLWGSGGVDGLEYQDRARAEW
jgi:metal-responsive CopG/Arc/MetJ family transcriptional regulator